MNFYDLALAGIRDIAPYQPGKPMTELSRELGISVDKIVKLASNENPLGMSRKAKVALLKAADHLSRYPDDFELKNALSAHLKLNADHIVLGNGSSDVLDMIARVFLMQGRSAVYSRYAFAIYPIAILAANAEPICVPAAPDFGHDLVAMKNAIRDDTHLVFIANPNNPTGNFLPYDTLKAFLREVPQDVLVILDEAYNEYLPAHLREDTTRWLSEFPNLVIVRTFSKIYGLAGLRVGYALAQPDVADFMNRVRQPFNCNNLAVTAASAALQDVAFLKESFELNQNGMAQLTEGFTQLGLAWIPSYGNFVTVEVKDAARVNQALLKEGVIVRPLLGYGMKAHLRITIGTARENARFLEVLQQVMKA